MRTKEEILDDLLDGAGDNPHKNVQATIALTEVLLDIRDLLQTQSNKE